MARLQQHYGQSQPTSIQAPPSFRKKNLGNLEISTAFPTRSSHIKISQASEDGISMLAPSTCWIFGFSLKKKKEIKIGKKLRSPLCVAGAVLKASARSDAHQVATLQTLFGTVEAIVVLWKLHKELKSQKKHQ